MDYTLTPEVEDYRARIAEFVRRELLPVEADRKSYDEHENIRIDLLESLRAQARRAGLWALQMPKERGGQGLPVVGMAACYEEMNFSIFGPVVFNSADTFHCASSTFASAADCGNSVVSAKPRVIGLAG